MHSRSFGCRVGWSVGVVVMVWLVYEDNLWRGVVVMAVLVELDSFLQDRLGEEQVDFEALLETLVYSRSLCLHPSRFSVPLRLNRSRTTYLIYLILQITRIFHKLIFLLIVSRTNIQVVEDYGINKELI